MPRKSLTAGANRTWLLAGAALRDRRRCAGGLGRGGALARYAVQSEAFEFSEDTNHVILWYIDLFDVENASVFILKANAKSYSYQNYTSRSLTSHAEY